LVHKETGAVTDTFSSTLTSADYVLVDCVEGDCKQTQGYIKENRKIRVFIGDNGFSSLGKDYDENNKGPTEVVNCAAESNVGKLSGEHNLKGICIGNGMSLDFAEDEVEITNHIIMAGAENTPFHGDFVVKRGTRYIIRDMFYNSKYTV